MKNLFTNQLLGIVGLVFFIQCTYLQAQVLESDSLALVELYNATGGDNWTNKTGWLTEPVSEWSGVTLSGGERVREIDLSSNNLVGELPDLDLSSLRELKLSSNNLTSVPDFSNLPNLTWLILRSNNLTNIPNFSSLFELYIFDLSINNLTSVPDFNNLFELELLILEENNLTSVPDFSGLSILRILDLEKNNLTSVPDFSNFVLLEYLYLDENRLTSVPDFSNLSRLKTLSLRENNLTTVPDFSNLTSLEQLDIYENRLTSVPFFSNLPALQTLQLAKNNLTTVPDFSGIPNLTELEIWDNHLISIPDFTNLPNLIKLILSNNELDNIPNFSSLQKLETLILSQNNLIEIEDFSNLPNLQELDLMINNLISIPNFSKLQNLLKLDLSRNTLTSVPDFNNLPNVTELDLSENSLMTIPYFSNFPNLTKLSLHENNLTFERIEHYAQQNYTPVSSFDDSVYAPQNNITTNDLGNNTLSVSAGGTLSNNTYTWYKDDIAYEPIAEENTLTITETGTYRCEIINSIATELILISQNLTINNITNCLTNDSLALVDIYNTTGGENWTNNTGWLTAPVSQWHGITLGVNDCSISILNLSNNNLVGEVPDLSLPNLVTLALDSNQLTSVPDFTNLGSLLYFSISHNDIGSLPDFTNLPNLSHLRANNNNLTSIPDFTNLPNLFGLYLWDNPLLGSVPDFTTLSSLVELDLANTGLTAVPNFSSLVSLKVLDISYNALVFTPIEYHIGLSYDSLAYNNQDSIPTNNLGNNILAVSAGGTLVNNTYRWYKDGVAYPPIGGDSTFTITETGTYRCEVTNSIATELTLNSREITINSIVTTNNCLTSDSLALVELYEATGGDNWVNNTGWLTAPVNEWHGVTLSEDECSVEEVNLNSNDLVGEVPDLNLPNLLELYLARNSLSSTADFSNLPNLTRLDLSHNNISSVPDFSHLVSLTYLTLYVNNLSLAPDFTNLLTLNTLNLGGNNFTTVPDFSNLSNLTSLTLTHNDLELVPDFSSLLNLTRLHLSYNKLITVPNFSKLPNLTHLNLDYNELTIVPSFDKLLNLTYLDLGQCNIFSISELGNFPNLTNLYLQDNNLTFNGIEYHAQQNYPTYIYNLQDSIPTNNLGNNTLSVSAGGTPSNNTYTWYKDGISFPPIVEDSTLTITETGVYRCEVTNSIATELTLYSREITVTSIANTDNCLTSDSLALVMLMDSLGVANWTNAPNSWINLPIKDWPWITFSGDGCSVVEVNLSNTNLVGKVPDLNLPNLTHIYLSDNSIDELADFTHLKKLIRLDVDINRLRKIPDFTNLEALTQLDVSSNEIDELPNFTKLTTLTDLDVRDNHLSSVPNFDKLLNLIRFDLSFNALVEVPNFENLLVLTDLDLSSNLLTTISEYSTLLNINRFDLANNQLTFDGIEYHAQQNYTIYEYSPQDSIPTNDLGNNILSVSGGGTLSNNTYAWYKDGNPYEPIVGDSIFPITETGVYRCEITNSIATELTLYSREITVNSIATTDNCLTSDSLALVMLMDSLGVASWANDPASWINRPVSEWPWVRLTLDSCNVLEIRLGSQNLVGTLPNISLPNLRFLILSDNGITAIADTLDFPNLERLSLNKNELTNIPDIVGLSSLETWYLDENSLGTLPDFSHLSTLVYLSLLDANLDTLPNFSNFPNMQSLTVSNNRLVTVPDWNLPSLRVLRLGHNELEMLPDFTQLRKLRELIVAYNRLSLCPSFGQLDSLQILDVRHNELTTLPTFPQLTIDPSLTSLKVHGNQLIFEGIEYHAQQNYAEFSYAPQATIPTHDVGNNTLSVYAGGSLENNTYTWYKDGNPYEPIVGDSIRSITETGVYRCEITNSVAIDLTLYSEEYTVNTINIPTYNAGILQGLDSVYCAGSSIFVDAIGYDTSFEQSYVLIQNNVIENIATEQQVFLTPSSGEYQLYAVNHASTYSITTGTTITELLNSGQVALSSPLPIIILKPVEIQTTTFCQFPYLDAYFIEVNITGGIPEHINGGSYSLNTLGGQTFIFYNNTTGSATTTIGPIQDDFDFFLEVTNDGFNCKGSTLETAIPCDTLSCSSIIEVETNQSDTLFICDQLTANIDWWNLPDNIEVIGYFLANEDSVIVASNKEGIFAKDSSSLLFYNQPYNLYLEVAINDLSTTDSVCVKVGQPIPVVFFEPVNLFITRSCAVNGQSYSVTANITGGELSYTQSGSYTINFEGQVVDVPYNTPTMLGDISSGSGFTLAIDSFSNFCSKEFYHLPFSCDNNCTAEAGNLSIIGNETAFCQGLPLQVSSEGFSVDYIQSYVLTDAQGFIAYQSSDGWFFNVDAGLYKAMAINAPVALTEGQNINELSDCYAISSQVEIIVTSPITVSLNAICLSEEQEGYTISLTVRGGMPDIVGSGVYILNYPILGTNTPNLLWQNGIGRATIAKPNGELFLPGETVNIVVFDESGCQSGVQTVVMPTETCNAETASCPTISLNIVDNSCLATDNIQATLTILSGDLSADSITWVNESTQEEIGTGFTLEYLPSMYDTCSPTPFYLAAYTTCDTLRDTITLYPPLLVPSVSNSTQTLTGCAYTFTPICGVETLSITEVTVPYNSSDTTISVTVTNPQNICSPTTLAVTLPGCLLVCADNPVISNITTDCTNDASEMLVTFEVSGGEMPYYIDNEEFTTSFISLVLPITTTTIEVIDNQNCNTLAEICPFAMTDFENEEECLIETCGEAIVDLGIFLDKENNCGRISYVLVDSSSNTIIAQSYDRLRFEFDVTNMDYGKTYYVHGYNGIANDALPLGIDTTNYCYAKTVKEKVITWEEQVSLSFEDNQVICGLETNIDVSVINGTVGIGQWLVYSETDLTNPIATLDNVTDYLIVPTTGTYLLIGEWEVMTVCQNIQDTLTITFITANAGADQETTEKEIQLSAIGTGKWAGVIKDGTTYPVNENEVEIGDNEIEFDNPDNPTTKVEVDEFGIYQFVWETTENCQDITQVTFKEREERPCNIPFNSFPREIIKKVHIGNISNAITIDLKKEIEKEIIYVIGLGQPDIVINDIHTGYQGDNGVISEIDEDNHTINYPISPDQVYVGIDTVEYTLKYPNNLNCPDVNIKGKLLIDFVCPVIKVREIEQTKEGCQGWSNVTVYLQSFNTTGQEIGVIGAVFDIVNATNNEIVYENISTGQRLDFLPNGNYDIIARSNSFITNEEQACENKNRLIIDTEAFCCPLPLSCGSEKTVQLIEVDPSFCEAVVEIKSKYFDEFPYQVKYTTEDEDLPNDIWTWYEQHNAYRAVITLPANPTAQLSVQYEQGKTESCDCKKDISIPPCSFSIKTSEPVNGQVTLEVFGVPKNNACSIKILNEYGADVSSQVIQGNVNINKRKFNLYFSDKGIYDVIVNGNEFKKRIII